MKSDRPKNPHAMELGRLGGRRKTEAQRAASQRNGKLGGRPRKTQVEKSAPTFPPSKS